MNLLETYNNYKEILDEAWSNISTQDTEDDIENELNKSFLAQKIFDLFDKKVKWYTNFTKKVILKEPITIKGFEIDEIIFAGESFKFTGGFREKDTISLEVKYPLKCNVYEFTQLIKKSKIQDFYKLEEFEKFLSTSELQKIYDAIYNSI